jgi:4a-hydroxytetrahydrobiopterin dehydratase
MSPDTTRPLADEVILERLARELPAWGFEDNALQRSYRTENWKSTLMVANTIGHLAEVAWHHPELFLSYGTVGVRLNSHDAGGVTERDFELARRIEQVVLWRPDREGGALTGTPDDDRFRYLRHD